MHALLISGLLSLAPLDADGLLGDFAWTDGFASVSQWAPRPEWLPGASKTASVTSDGSVACFRVDEPGQGMKWSRDVPAIPLAEQPYLVLRYREENLDTTQGDYLVYVNVHLPGRDLYAIRLNEVKADDAWHLAAVDLSAMTEAPEIHAVAIQVRASAQGKARLWVDQLGFYDSPPDGAECLPRTPATPRKPDWKAPLERATWAPQSAWLANPAAAGAHRAERSGEDWQFRVGPSGSGMKWSWGLPAPIKPEGYRYLSIRYRARACSAQSDYAVCVLGQKRSGQYGDMPVVGPTNLVPDGRWHMFDADWRRVAKEFAAVQTLAVQVQAAGPETLLEIADIRLTNARSTVHLADAVDWKPEAAFAQFQPIRFDAAMNASSALWRRHLRLAEWFSGDAVTVQGVPFSLMVGPKDLAATPIREKSKLRFACDVAASEVHLLVVAAFRGDEEPAYGVGPLAAIRDVDRFRLRLEYADGTADECLPMNLANRQFAIAHGLQVLVAAADPAKRLRAVVLCDRCKQATFAVAAITARTGSRLAPEALEEVQPLRLHVGQAFQPDFGRLGVRLESPTYLVKLQVDGKPVDAGDLEPCHGENSRQTKWYRVRTASGVRLGIGVQSVGKTNVKLAARVENGGPGERTVVLIAPAVGPYRLGEREEDSWYWFPRRGTALDWRSCSHRERYCGLFPVQFIDTFNPVAGIGLTLRTLDSQCLLKHYLLEKKDNQFTLGVEYPERRLKPGETFRAADAVVSLTDGDWRRGLAAYRDWVKTWHRPISPRKPWFREVFNFRQRFLWWLDPLYDAKSGKLDLQRAVDEARREFGGIDYLHLFDWGNCGPYGRIYGRTGDYSPYKYLKGGREGLHAAIAAIRAQGVPVGLYIEAYLLDKRGKLGQGPGTSWQMLGADGQGRWWPESTEMYVCSYVPAWRDVQRSTYATKVRELDVDGMYLDEYGFAGSWVDCHAKVHGHPVPGYAAVGERDCTQFVRRAIDQAKPGVALYSEETPVDVTTQYQDGSFTYAMSSASSAATRVPLNSTRFALPDFKTIEILYCDKPTGSWATGVRCVFFNGEAIWLEGPAQEWFEPETRAEIRRSYAILRKHRDAFTTLEPIPLVPTEVGGVFANAFPAPGKTVYTVYNSRHRTVRGPVLRVAQPAGMRWRWYDEWQQRPASVYQDGDSVVVSLEIGPQGVGCVVAETGL